MSTITSPWRKVLILLYALTVPMELAAEDAHKTKHHHYKLIDVGTLGGPTSYVNALLYGGSTAPVMNQKAIVAGWADTATPDPFPAACFDLDCLVSHAFSWHDGSMSDLGTLAVGWSSAAMWINDTGEIVGISQNGIIDPVIGIPERRAVRWRHGQITDLGTLGGSHSEASAINNRGQVAGLALNSTPDPFSIYDLLFFGSSAGTQTRAVLWDEDGTAQDLGTLGGPDAFAVLVNDRGQVTGWSYTNSTPNASTGLPTFHPYLWEKGKGMQDLGTLGGTIAQAVNGMNERGEVVGSTTMAGDQTHHPFLWDGKQLIDLGTLGGDNGEADWINDAGEVVGIAQLQECPGEPPDRGGDAFLWRRGELMDLGSTAGLGNSEAVYINAKAQVVGYSFTCDFSAFDAFLWENGSIVDLNMLTLNSVLQLVWALFIDDNGEIVAVGLLPNGDGHAALLIPCDEGHPDIEGCDYSPVELSTVAASHATETQKQVTPQAIGRIRDLLMKRQHGFMPRTIH